jgi:hypothetical protein
MKALNRRIQRLEQKFAWQRAAEPCPSPAPEIAQWLASRGFIREQNESLAEVMGRAFGWTMNELRAALMRRAMGLPVEWSSSYRY